MIDLSSKTYYCNYLSTHNLIPSPWYSEAPNEAVIEYWIYSFWGPLPGYVVYVGDEMLVI